MVKDINLNNPADLAAIRVGDKIFVNNWIESLTVTHRTDKYLLLQIEDSYSVIELIPTAFSCNHREAGYFTAGGDYWLFGWAGWYVDGELTVNKSTMEAYLRSFESGETEFSRNAIAIKSMTVVTKD